MSKVIDEKLNKEIDKVQAYIADLHLALKQEQAYLA